MRTWLKWTLGGVAIFAIALTALAGTSAYYIFRSMEKHQAGEPDAVQAIDAIKTRFGSRPPLIEISDLQRADIRINRPTEASATHVGTVHIVNWKSETGELMRTEMPLWLMRFSSVNILSQLGVAPAQFRLTVDDIERYGPGVIVDYSQQGTFRLFLWVD
jgi:hypothetical protein